MSGQTLSQILGSPAQFPHLNLTLSHTSFEPFLKVLDLWQISNFYKRLNAPAASPSELRVLEHLKHGVKYGQHYQVTMHQPATVRGRPLRICDFCFVKPIKGK